MSDLVVLALTLVLTAITLLYGDACDLLMRSDSTRDRGGRPLKDQHRG
jgi:hypothetical protein